MAINVISLTELELAFDAAPPRRSKAGRVRYYSGFFLDKHVI